MNQLEKGILLSQDAFFHIQVLSRLMGFRTSSASSAFLSSVSESSAPVTVQVASMHTPVETFRPNLSVKFDEKLEVGTMIETPAAVLIADELAEECDFFSIGTNDLTQYTCALDRQNAKLEPFFNPHHPAVLRAIKMTIDAGHRHGIWVGICGELGADTALTETFLRMGVDELSMNAKSVLPVRKIIRSIDLSKPSDK